MDFGKPTRFVPQKTRALKRLKQLVVAGGVVGVMAVGGLVYALIR